MYLKLKAICLACLCCITMHAQWNHQPVSIGDSINYAMFNDMKGPDGKKIPLNKLEEQLLILDFWGTTCTSCIKFFPKVEALQAEFGERVRILLANAVEPDTVIMKFQDKYEARKGKLSLPVVSDTLLHKSFPFVSVPTYAWIYQGKLLAITNYFDVTSQNIAMVLAGKPVNFRMKIDFAGFDPGKPLLKDGNGGDSSKILFHSLLTKELGLSIWGKKIFVDSNQRRTVYFDMSVIDLFQQIYKFDRSRIVLDVKDPASYDWRSAPEYSYEITVPARTTIEQEERWTLADFERYLGLNGRMENRKIKCLVLKRIPGVPIVNTDTSKATIREEKDGTVYFFHHQPLRIIVRSLNEVQFVRYPIPLPVIDETGYKGLVSIALPSVYMRDDADRIKKAFREQGFELVEAVREMEVFVLSDK